MPPRMPPRERAKISSPEIPAEPKVKGTAKARASLAPAHAREFRMFAEGRSIRQIARLTSTTRSVVETWAVAERWVERREELEEAAKARTERIAVRYMSEIRESGLRVRAKLIRRIETKIERGQKVTSQELNWLALAVSKVDEPANNPRVAPVVAVQNNLGDLSLAEVLLSDGWKQWSADPANITPEPPDDAEDAELSASVTQALPPAEEEV